VAASPSAVADPEVLARGGELRGHKAGRVWGGGHAPSQKIFAISEVKTAHFVLF